MWTFGILFALKVVSFLAALAQTIGFIGLFAFEVLQPLKWHLLIGGTITIVASEGIAYLIARRAVRKE